MRKVLMVVMGWMAVTGLSFGQAASRLLTFEEAVKLAMENNVLLNTQRNNLEYSQMQRTQSLAGAGPTVSVTTTAQRYNGNSFNPNTGQVINGVRDNVTGTLNANINLFSGLNRINQIKQYANALEAQTHFVNRTAQDAINTVSNQYLSVMLDVELLKIARENYEAQQKQLEQIRELVRLGARSPVDEYNQDALTKAAELRMVQAEIQMNNDKALLSQTLLLDPVELYDVEKPNWDINTIDYNTSNVEELASKAKLYRGDYLRAEKQEAAQRFAASAWKGFMMPSLYAFGSIGTAYNFQHDVPQTITDGSGNTIPNPSYPRDWTEQVRNDNVYKNFGVQLAIPIFSGLQNRTSYVQQKILYENAQLNRRNMEMQIRNDVVRAVRNFDGARKAFSVTSDGLKAAEMAFGLETERYNLGVTNFVDYTNANRVFVQAQTDKAQAEYRLVFQRILLEYAIGTLKPEDFQK